MSGYPRQYPFDPGAARSTLDPVARITTFRKLTSDPTDLPAKLEVEYPSSLPAKGISRSSKTFNMLGHTNPDEHRPSASSLTPHRPHYFSEYGSSSDLYPAPQNHIQIQTPRIPSHLPTSSLTPPTSPDAPSDTLYRGVQTRSSESKLGRGKFRDETDYLTFASTALPKSTSRSSLRAPSHRPISNALTSGPVPESSKFIDLLAPRRSSYSAQGTHADEDEDSSASASDSARRHVPRKRRSIKDLRGPLHHREQDRGSPSKRASGSSSTLGSPSRGVKTVGPPGKSIRKMKSVPLLRRPPSMTASLRDGTKPQTKEEPVTLTSCQIGKRRENSQEADSRGLVVDRPRSRNSGQADLSGLGFRPLVSARIANTSSNLQPAISPHEPTGPVPSLEQYFRSHGIRQARTAELFSHSSRSRIDSASGDSDAASQWRSPELGDQRSNRSGPSSSSFKGSDSETSPNLEAIVQDPSFVPYGPRSVIYPSRLHARDSGVATDVGEAIEEVMESHEKSPAGLEESRARFLRRHSRDFAHLHQAYLTQPPHSAPLPESSRLGLASPPTVEPIRSSPSDQLDMEAVARERKALREKRRSWVLAKAGWTSSIPVQSVPLKGEDTASASPTVPGAAHHRRTSSTTFFAPSVHPTRQTTLSGGPKPLTLVSVQNRKKNADRLSISSPAAIEAVVTSPTDDGDSLDARSAMHRRGESRGHVVTRSLRVSAESTMDPSSALSTPSKSIPPHLRSFSSSTNSTSSLSSLGQIIAGYSPGASTSSCSSGANHMGGPLEIGPEALNFHMQVTHRPGQRKQRPLSINRTSFAPSDSRLSHIWTLAENEAQSESESPSPSTSQLLHDDGKDARLARRRARAFMMAGLKLEQGSERPESQITLEQSDAEEADDSDAKLRRRAGLVLEEGFELDQPDVVVLDRAQDKRKRYSVMRREKEPILHPSIDTKSSNHFLTHLESQNGIDGQAIASSATKERPELTITVTDRAFPLGSSLNMVENEAPHGGPSGGELAITELARPWSSAPGSSSLSAKPQSESAVKSAPDLEGTASAERHLSPTRPTFVHPDSNGASPGRESKTTWATGVRNWMRKSEKTTEGETEKGFGFGRGEEDKTTKMQANHEKMPHPPADEHHHLQYRPSLTRVGLSSWTPSWANRKGLERSPQATDEPITAHRESPLPISGTHAMTSQASSPAVANLTPLLYQSRTADPFSPSSVNSSSLLTPAMHPTTKMSTSGKSQRAMTQVNVKRDSGYYPMGLPHILSPTPNDVPFTPDSAPYLRPLEPTASQHDPHIRRQRSDPGLQGLGLGMDIPTVQGLRDPPISAGTWQYDFALHTAALVQAANQKRQADSTAQIGLSNRRTIAEKIFGTRRRNGAPTHLDETPGAGQARPALSERDPTLSASKAQSLNEKTAKNTHETSGLGFSERHEYRLTRRQKPGALVPAQLFFVLGFVLGPWVWLLGGWGLTPAGLFLPSSSTARRTPSHADRRVRKTQVPPLRLEPHGRRYESATPMDLPDKWVVRNRWAAVVSGAVFIPAMCIGWAYVGHLL